MKIIPLTFLIYLLFINYSFAITLNEASRFFKAKQSCDYAQGVIIKSENETILSRGQVVCAWYGSLGNGTINERNGCLLGLYDLNYNRYGKLEGSLYFEKGSCNKDKIQKILNRAGMDSLKPISVKDFAKTEGGSVVVLHDKFGVLSSSALKANLQENKIENDNYRKEEEIKKQNEVYENTGWVFVIDSFENIHSDPADMASSCKIFEYNKKAIYSIGCEYKGRNQMVNRLMSDIASIIATKKCTTNKYKDCTATKDFRIEKKNPFRTEEIYVFSSSFKYSDGSISLKVINASNRQACESAVGALLRLMKEKHSFPSDIVSDVSKGKYKFEIKGSDEKDFGRFKNSCRGR